MPSQRTATTRTTTPEDSILYYVVPVGDEIAGWVELHTWEDACAIAAHCNRTLLTSHVVREFAPAPMNAG